MDNIFKTNHKRYENYLNWFFETFVEPKKEPEVDIFAKFHPLNAQQRAWYTSQLNDSSMSIPNYSTSIQSLTSNIKIFNKP